MIASLREFVIRQGRPTAGSQEQVIDFGLLLTLLAYFLQKPSLIGFGGEVSRLSILTEVHATVAISFLVCAAVPVCCISRTVYGDRRQDPSS